MLVPMTLWAQDNTWERPEVDEQAEAAKAKENVNAKYLRGAVPEVDGRVVFTKHIEAPGKSASQIYDILHQYLQKMTKEKNQLENSKLVTEDTQKHELVASFEEWLIYEEQRKAQRISAEEWITDKEAVNKKNTKLYPGSGKFRRKTIDRKDFLFNKFESLLNEH